jgi:CRP-like cAMP-binding protein
MSINLDLREFSVFSALTPAELAILCEVARERRYPAGKKIFEKGDTGASLFMIVNGRVKIMLPDDGHETDIELATLSRGDIFGEMSLFDGKPRPAMVRAEVDTSVIELEREPFLKQVQTNPDIALKVLGIMIDRIRHSDNRVRDFAERVIQKAAPRVDEEIASRLEAAKVIYEKTENHAERVVAHVDRTWTALVRVGSTVMIFAAVVGLGLGAFGISTFYDAIKEIGEAKEEAEKSSPKATQELKNIQTIRKEAL